MKKFLLSFLFGFFSISIFAVAGEGTAVIQPISVLTGSTTSVSVTLTVGASGTIGTNCIFYIPTNWTTPTLSNGNPGYVTIVAQSGQGLSLILMGAGSRGCQIQENLNAGEIVSLYYGYGSGNEVTAPLSAETSLFDIKTSNVPGPPSSILSLPSILVLDPSPTITQTITNTITSTITITNTITPTITITSTKTITPTITKTVTKTVTSTVTPTTTKTITPTITITPYYENGYYLQPTIKTGKVDITGLMKTKIKFQWISIDSLANSIVATTIDIYNNLKLWKHIDVKTTPSTIDLKGLTTDRLIVDYGTNSGTSTTSTFSQ